MLTDEQKAYWHPTKNAHLDPETLGSKSHALAWWVGECRHEWESPILDFRNKCIYCGNLKLLKGFNDLASTYPDVASEWSHEGTNLRPENIIYNSTIRVKWKCRNNHSWQAPIRNRTIDNSKCSYCLGIKLWTGFNDVKTKHPEILKYWDYQKNDLPPEKVLYTSQRKIAWKDKSCNHEWTAHVYRFVLAKEKCPYCSNRIMKKGINDYTITHPHVFQEWNYEKNKKDPSLVKSSDQTKYWWVGENCGHEWEQTVAKRIYRKAGCIYCQNQAVLRGFNDLATSRPDLAKAWSRKNTVRPEEIISNTKELIILECELGHETKVKSLATVFTQQKFCKICLNREFYAGYNDYATKNPVLAEEWSPNNPLTASEVIFNSNEEVEWVCKEKQHVWKKAPVKRTSYPSCPECLANSYSSLPEKELHDFIVKFSNYAIETNVRKVLPGSEIDIYIEESSLGIEYNGIHWHSTQFKNEFYHLNKYNKAVQRNITLLQVSEYEYSVNKELTLSRIKAYFDSKLISPNEIQIKEELGAINFWLNNEWVGKTYIEHQDKDFNVTLVTDIVSLVPVEILLETLLNKFEGKKVIFEQDNEWPFPFDALDNLDLVVAFDAEPKIIEYRLRGQSHYVWDSGKTYFTRNTDIVYII